MIQEAPGAFNGERAHAGGAAQAAPLRVVHVVSSLNVGGMEHFVLRIAAAQRRLGHEATVLALHGGPLAEQARKEGVPVRVLTGRNALARVLETVAYLGGQRPRVIHPHNPSSLHYALVGKSVSGAKLVLTYHGRGLREARTPHAGEWCRTDAVVSVSHGAVEQLPVAVPASRVTVIRNGVLHTPPSADRKQLRSKLGLGAGPVGVMVARMDGLKGHDTLVRAVANVRDSGRAVTVLLAGDGAERPRIEGLARELDLGPEWLRFLGFRTDVPDLLTAADFFLLPSVTEGLPLSMLEAMTHGLPVLATPVGGIPEVIRDSEHGYLVPVHGHAELAAAMARLVDDPGLLLALGQRARCRAMEEFSFERMTREYLELYQRLLGR
jgi:glycosyltransferase involved in cell wall biosynthesis